MCSIENLEVLSKTGREIFLGNIFWDETKHIEKKVCYVSSYMRCVNKTKFILYSSEKGN